MKEKRLVLVLAALLLIILGVVSYLLASGKLTSRVPYETSIRNMEIQSDSDEVADIEADLNTTELDNLDKELGDIESELNSE